MSFYIYINISDFILLILIKGAILFKYIDFYEYKAF